MYIRLFLLKRFFVEYICREKESLLFILLILFFRKRLLLLGDLFDCCFALKLILFLWGKWCWVILDATFLLIIATITITILFWLLIFILTLFFDLFFRLFLYFNQFFNYFCIKEMVALLDLATTMITWTLFIRRAIIVWYIFVFDDYLLLRWIK